MAKLKLIDTKDKFLLEIDGTEIPYVTSYQITRTVSEVVLSSWLSALLMLNQSKSFQTKLPTKNRRCTYAERKTYRQLG
jgi:hypothetical protein